jgi:hypothetical protein
MVAKRDEITGRWDVDGLPKTETTYAEICAMLETNLPFKFARYGDGEFNCMFGKVGRNCDGHEYTPELARRLYQALKNAYYMIGVQPLALTLYQEKIRYLIDHKLDVVVNADVLHNASIDGTLPQFIKALDRRYVILVGPAHLSKFFNAVHIVIPEVNCWTMYEETKKQLAFHLEESKEAVVLFAASMMSEVLIDDFKLTNHTLIDVGSCFDPYCGVKSRRYHHKLAL